MGKYGNISEHIKTQQPTFQKEKNTGGGGGVTQKTLSQSDLL